ncbi:MAG: glycosyltransferase family 2 protein [Candidatus Bathyarchaeia archaeon]
MKIAAVVVTYNRKELLRRCLSALLKQTRVPDEIIVVDNASNDGTEYMVSSEFCDVTYLRLPTNTGGAGGFHEGTRWAVNKGYDWIWLMDDDGVPDPNCLSALIDWQDSDLKIRAPLILIEDDPERKLAFGVVFKGKKLEKESEVWEVAENGFLIKAANPFNGILIHRSVFESIGFPKKEFFLWGDETEFLLRASKGGFKYGIIVRAIFFHPPNRMTSIPVKLRGFSFEVYHTGNDFRDFLIIRNKAYILWRYYGFRAYITHIAKYSLFYLSRYGWKQGFQALRAALYGALGKFDWPTPDSLAERRI